MDMKERDDLMIKIDRAFEKLKREHLAKLRSIDRMNYIMPVAIVALFITMLCGVVVSQWRSDAAAYHRLKKNCLTDGDIQKYMMTGVIGADEGEKN